MGEAKLIPLCRCPNCGSMSNTERFCALHEGGLMVERVDDDLASRLEAAEKKAEAYDRARALVKTEGRTRAKYVLLAEAAKARITELEGGLDELIEKHVQRQREFQVERDWAAFDAEQVMLDDLRPLRDQVQEER